MLRKCVPPTTRTLIAYPAVLIPGIERLIVTLRGERLLLDADLVRIYGVPTYRFNEAVKRNLDRFPPDFIFRLSQEECRASRL